MNISMGGLNENGIGTWFTNLSWVAWFIIGFNAIDEYPKPYTQKDKNNAKCKVIPAEGV